jgi:NAD(P)-dependent dehydrogenase (short-subunit alcohol dehydrogenase family)
MGITYNPFSLEGKTILVTGASSGIGRSAAIECSRIGARVIITARNSERLKQTFDSLSGKNHEMIICDLEDTSQIEVMTNSLPELQGVINNAGYTKILPIPFIDEDSLKGILQVDTIAPILILKNLVKKKKLKQGASVVFTSSLAGLGKVSFGNTMYAASKGAISSFVQGAAFELASKGIRVNAVCPGMVDTKILDSGTISNEQLEKDKLNYPLKRYGKPEEVAWAMIYLLSEASAWVTGTNMVIDGGITAK